MVSDTPPFPTPVKLGHNKAQPIGDSSFAALSPQGTSILTARFFARAGAARVGLRGHREGPLLDNNAAIEKESPGTRVFIQSTDVIDETALHSAFDTFTKDGNINTAVAKAFIRNAVPDAHVAINSWGNHLRRNDTSASYCDTVLPAKPNLGVFHTQPGVILTETNLRVGSADTSFNLELSTPEARFLKGKFLWRN
ncbi:hypothetical protein T440DRAFT_492034 [Plenodomus tracheiphilus IPT5]|uniref:NAD(P)-binding protein n=1 Tax=Plenodomus tracheiphilus IPT5 TaxID=1408161 RepID=A0A6A7AVU8_9PLEO|nr:hypothetical protein T440DRAFT_492034 [Plenodomus tracheiphilus IPT5]